MWCNRLSSIWEADWKWKGKSSYGSEGYGDNVGGTDGGEEQRWNFGIRDTGFILQMETFLRMAMGWLEIMSHHVFIFILFTCCSSLWNLLHDLFLN